MRSTQLGGARGTSPAARAGACCTAALATAADAATGSPTLHSARPIFNGLSIGPRKSRGVSATRSDARLTGHRSRPSRSACAGPPERYEALVETRRARLVSWVDHGVGASKAQSGRARQSTLRSPQLPGRTPRLRQTKYVLLEGASSRIDDNNRRDVLDGRYAELVEQQGRFLARGLEQCLDEGIALSIVG
jgi:hypothetical protein